MNISNRGAEIDGSDSDSSTLRVATQFVGAVLPGGWKDTKIFMTNGLASNVAANTMWERVRGGPKNGTYYTSINMNWKGHRTNPSELARTLLHEYGHHRDRGGMVTLNNPQHQQIDSWARQQLKSSGLGSGGCSSVGGIFGWFTDYPGCD